MGLDGLDYPGLPWAVGAGAVAVHGFPWSTEGLGKASKASRVLLERWEQKAGSLVMSTWLTVKFLVQKCNWKPFLFLELWALSWQSRFSKTNTETKANKINKGRKPPPTWPGDEDGGMEAEFLLFQVKKEGIGPTAWGPWGIPGPPFCSEEVS